MCGDAVLPERSGLAVLALLALLMVPADLAVPKPQVPRRTQARCVQHGSVGARGRRDRVPGDLVAGNRRSISSRASWRAVTGWSPADSSEGARRIALDAADAVALTREADGSAVMYNCMNPGDYTRWEDEWPPLQRSMLAAAESTGAVLATVSILYMHGPQAPGAVMTPDFPEDGTDHKGVLRGRMDREALDSHRAGRIRTVIVRASDYVGAGVGPNGMGIRW